MSPKTLFGHLSLETVDTKQTLNCSFYRSLLIKLAWINWILPFYFLRVIANKSFLYYKEINAFIVSFIEHVFALQLWTLPNRLLILTNQFIKKKYFFSVTFRLGQHKYCPANDHSWGQCVRFTKYCYPLKVVFHQRLSFIKGRIPSRSCSTEWLVQSNFIFHQRLSSFKDCLLIDVIFDQSSSIKCFPS